MLRPRRRKVALSALTAASVILAGGHANAQGAAPHVRIASGDLAGSLQGNVVSFKGIPYAAAPVGPLRWQPPQPARPWKGVRAADRVGAVCQQMHNPSDAGVGPLPMSEDCLTVNVFAPSGAKRLPVMFWIHGGGFVNGSGTAPLYDGTALARQDVVVVTINYRLGRFGFFAHPALTAEANGRPVGNYALMDMIAALKWTRANIARFGGDPRQVTIFGESAGGAAVNSLMVSPAARGLFARAIVQSGLGREPVPPLAEAERAGVSFAAAHGLGKATAADLRKLDAETILKAGDPQMMNGGAAMVDGKILRESPLAGFRAGRQAAVPYIVGWNSLEFPVAAAAMAGRLGAGSPLTPEVLERLKPAYPNAASFDQNLLSDVLFVEPALALARYHAMRGHPTYAYQFSVLAKPVRAMFKGTPHAMERQYVFQTLGTSSFPADSNDAAQAAAVSAYWAAFAKAGDPNGGGRPAWPRFQPTSPALMEFTDDGPKPGEIPRMRATETLSAIYE
jgi:para-nitrobenzyl esterase